MRDTVKIVVAIAAVAAVAWPACAGQRVHHGVKHRGHHPHAHRGAPAQPSMAVPTEHPGYRYGGPLYSTCDRINADRMLVGTCR